MPRNAKCRKVCAEFQHKVFIPENDDGGFVTITVDEIEALRLCDVENMDQEDAALKMEVSRGTFQRILYSARRKSAEALCDGKGVLIQGGNYEIVGNSCGCKLSCKKCRM
jgi:predicted DNA-binding protein (UPF0251 family)